MNQGNDASVGESTATGVTADEIAGRIDRVPIGRFHYRLAALLASGTFFDGFDAIMIASALPAIVLTLHVGTFDTGLIIGAAYLGQFLGAIAFGFLSERYGRKQAFVWSVVLFGLCSVVLAFTWSADSLLVLRIIQGVGLGAEAPVAATLFNEYLRGRSRGKAGMVYESAFLWGSLLAPLVALLAFTLAGPGLGWRVLFAVGALPLAVAILAHFALPESARWLAEHGRTDEADAHVRRMERDAEAVHGRLAEPVVVAGPVTTPTRFTEVLSRRYASRTVLTWVLWATTYFVTYGFTTWLPSLYVQLGGLSRDNALWLTVLTWLVEIAFFYVAAVTFDRLGRRVWFLLGYGIALAATVIGVVLSALTGTPAWPVLFACGLVMGVGLIVPGTALYIYTPELYPTRMRAWGTSTGGGIAKLASAGAPIAVGALLVGGLGMTAVFAMFGVVVLLALVVMAVLGIETKGRSLEEISE